MDMRQRLGNRSSKILGGYVTERAFIETFLAGGDILHTSSWWFSRRDPHVFYFVTKQELNALDKQVAKMLGDKKIPCFKLYHGDSGLVISTIDGRAQYTVEQFVAAYQLRRLDKQPSAQRFSVNENTQFQRLVAYYQAQDMLPEIERSIQIEDGFLNQYFYTSNVDVIFAHPGQLERPVCCEIKFKNEFTNHGTRIFGIDKFQLDGTYRYLEWAGMELYNVILYNDLEQLNGKTTTNIMDYIAQRPAAERRWAFARISRLVNYKEYALISNQTNFTSVKEKSRTVYYLPVSCYQCLTHAAQLDHVAAVNSDGTAVDLAAAEQMRCPRCDGALVRKTGPYGPFLGCENYRTKGCKYHCRTE